MARGSLDPRQRRRARAPARGHIAEIAGWAHVGIGSDLDGGFGREESPEEIDTIADLHTLGSTVPAEFREALLGENWLSFLKSTLPEVTQP